MSDIMLNACDENWWFGDTVKDFNAHRFLLGTASPIFHKILYGQAHDMFSQFMNLPFFFHEIFLSFVSLQGRNFLLRSKYNCLSLEKKTLCNPPINET